MIHITCGIMILSKNIQTPPERSGRRLSCHSAERTVTALTGRQKKFAEYYHECGNIVQSALKAGYSENYANARAHELLENVGVAAYIRKLAEKAQTERIMTARERQVLLSDMAKDSENDTADRIRAIDTLNKMTGEYTVKVDADVKQENPFADLTTEELQKLIGSG